jgi:hypothetical protein
MIKISKCEENMIEAAAGCLEDISCYSERLSLGDNSAADVSYI